MKPGVRKGEPRCFCKGTWSAFFAFDIGEMGHRRDRLVGEGGGFKLTVHIYPSPPH